MTQSFDEAPVIWDAIEFIMTFGDARRQDIGIILLTVREYVSLSSARKASNHAISLLRNDINNEITFVL